MKTSKATVFGRAWIFDDDPCTVEVWEHEFEPMTHGHRSGADWCREHLSECFSDEQLRALFSLPPEGNFQVIFKGAIEGWYSGIESEWDESFEVEEVRSEAIPDEFIRDMK